MVRRLRDFIARGEAERRVESLYKLIVEANALALAGGGDRGLDLLLDSLQRRMATMHGLYHQAVGSMDADHVNHFERDGVLPIAFSLFHYTNMEDDCWAVIAGGTPVWNEDW